MRNTSNQLWLSPLSIWELMVQRDKGRVTLESPFETWLKDARERAPMQEATLTNEVILAIASTRFTERMSNSGAGRKCARVGELSGLSLKRLPDAEEELAEAFARFAAQFDAVVETQEKIGRADSQSRARGLAHIA